MAKPYWADKELEAALTRQHIYIDYFDNIFVYGEKSREVDDFNRQHRNWIWAQFKTFIRNVRYLPTALMNRHYYLLDKLIQWYDCGIEMVGTFCYCGTYICPCHS